MGLLQGTPSVVQEKRHKRQFKYMCGCVIAAGFFAIIYIIVAASGSSLSNHLVSTSYAANQKPVANHNLAALDSIGKSIEDTTQNATNSTKPPPPTEPGNNEDPTKIHKSCTDWLRGGAVNNLEVLCGAGEDSMTQLISGVSNLLVEVISVVIIIMIIVSGIQMAASAGSPDAIKGAKKRLVGALVSLALLLSMRAIMAFLGVPIA